MMAAAYLKKVVLSVNACFTWFLILHGGCAWLHIGGYSEMYVPDIRRRVSWATEWMDEHAQAGAWDVDDTGLEYMPNRDVAEQIQQKVLKMYIRDSVICTGLLAAFCFWPLWAWSMSRKCNCQREDKQWPPGLQVKAWAGVPDQDVGQHELESQAQ